jgi:hypothetical protein
MGFLFARIKLKSFANIKNCALIFVMEMGIVRKDNVFVLKIIMVIVVNIKNDFLFLFCVFFFFFFIS